MTKLVIYLVCEPETPELAEAAVEGGADLIELGIPFSDPLAEGPTIRLASERALSRGMRTAECIECLAETRGRVDVPLVPMTYAAILEAYGYERFVTDTRAAGATSSIVVDLPVEEHAEVPRIQLVAPTSTDERIALCAANTDGWLYLVSLTGTTGARDTVSPALAGLVERTRSPDGLRRSMPGSGSPRPSTLRLWPPLQTVSSSAPVRFRSQPTDRRRCATTSPPCARLSTPDEQRRRRRRRCLRRLHGTRARSPGLGCHRPRAVHTGNGPLGVGWRHAPDPLRARGCRVVLTTRPPRTQPLEGTGG